MNLNEVLALDKARQKHSKVDNHRRFFYGWWGILGGISVRA